MPQTISLFFVAEKDPEKSTDPSELVRTLRDNISATNWLGMWKKSSTEGLHVLNWREIV